MHSQQPMRVVRFHALDYELSIDSALHPAFFPAAKRRICKSLQMVNKYYASVLNYALAHPAAKKVWAIVLEEANRPVYAVRNLGCTETLPHHILLVKCDTISQDTDSFYSIQIDIVDIIIFLMICVVAHNVALIYCMCMLNNL
jgi:hypothetical protein